MSHSQACQMWAKISKVDLEQAYIGYIYIRSADCQRYLANRGVTFTFARSEAA